MQASRLKICLLALAIFFLEVLDVTQSLPVGNGKQVETNCIKTKEIRYAEPNRDF
jgi:hypothetical protein